MLVPAFRCVQDCDKDKGGRAPFDPFNLQGPALSTFPGLRTTQGQALYRLSYWLGILYLRGRAFHFPIHHVLSKASERAELYTLSLTPQLAQDYCDTVSIVCCRPVTVAQESSVHNHRCSTQTPLSGFPIPMS